MTAGCSAGVGGEIQDSHYAALWRKARTAALQGDRANDRVEAALASRVRSGTLVLGVEAASATNPPAAGQPRNAGQVRTA
jgi:hypothetical protein